jgi:hypothetical protein
MTPIYILLGFTTPCTTHCAQNPFPHYILLGLTTHCTTHCTKPLPPIYITWIDDTLHHTLHYILDSRHNTPHIAHKPLSPRNILLGLTTHCTLRTNPLSTNLHIYYLDLRHSTHAHQPLPPLRTRILRMKRPTAQAMPRRSFARLN